MLSIDMTKIGETIFVATKRGRVELGLVGRLDRKQVWVDGLDGSTDEVDIIVLGSEKRYVLGLHKSAEKGDNQL